MATQIGVVKAMIGEVTATAADGSIRTLQVGDMVYANELISTGQGGAVEIEFADGSVMDLGRNSQAMLDSEVFDPDATAVAETASDDVPDDVAAIQQALLEGEDPTEVGEATAAGAGVEGGNEGHEAVFVDYLNPEVTPDAGFDTIGVSNEFDQPEEDIIILPEEEEPALPQVSVSVDVEIEIEDPQTPPPEDGIPTPEHPVIVSGNAASVLEGTSEGTKQVVFIINLSESFSEDVQVTYQLQPVSTNGAADNPDDWFDGVSPQTVTISAGDTSFPIFVEIVEDDIPEGNGVFEIVLISANNATINPDADSAMVTIYDDDVTVEATNALVDEDDIPVIGNDDSELGDDVAVSDGTISFDLGGSALETLSLAGGTISFTKLDGTDITTTWDSDTNTLIGHAVGDVEDVVFTVVLSNITDTGADYTVNLEQAVLHPLSDDPESETTESAFEDNLSFDVEVSVADDLGSDTYTFTITIDDDVPVAVNDGTNTAEDTAVTFNVLANDMQGADGAEVTSVVSTTGAGSAVVSGADSIQYTPGAGEEGSIDVVYEITDGDGDTSQATLTIVIGADSKPLAVDDSATVDESDLATIGSGLNPEDGGDNFGTVATGNLLANDTVNSGADLATITSVEGATPDADGVITVDTAAGILVVYTADFDGHTAGDYEYTLQDPTADGVDDSETFDYVLTDGDSASTSTATLTVNILDDEPVANDDGPVAVAEDTATDITVDVNDVAGADGVDFTDGTKVFVSTGAANGSVVYNDDGTFTYTPDAGFEGADSFVYTITDGDGDTDTATVTVNVAADSEPEVTVSNTAVDETGGLDSVDGTLAVDFGNDSGDVALSATGATWDGATNTLTANDGSWKVVNNQNGTYTFTQLAAMSHLGGEDASLDILITATATDVDNDVDAVDFTVTVYDDGPVVTDYDGVVNINDATPTLDVLDYDLGQDGLGSVSFSLNSSSVPLTSGGESVLTESVDLGDGREALIGYLESGDNAGYQEGEDGVVFTISPEAGDLDGDDGTYELILSTENVLDLPQTTIELSFSGIDAGGPVASVDVGSELTISAVDAGTLVNASNGFIGIDNNIMNDNGGGETVLYTFNNTLINDLQFNIKDVGGSGDTIEYTVFNSVDSTSEAGTLTINGDGLTDPISTNIDFDSIEFTVTSGDFKVGGITYTDTGDPEDVLVQFDYQGSDSDGDAVNGSIDVTVSDTTTTSITGSDLLSHPDSQVDPS